MKVQDIHFYYYNAEFKSAITTPKIKLTHRKALIVELVTDTHDSFYGECNAFETDWYDKETITSVKQTLAQWSEKIKNKTFTTFEEWLPYLELLDYQPAARCTIVMAIYQMYHSLPSFEVEYGATASGLTEHQLGALQATQPSRIKLKWSETLLSDIETLTTELPFNVNFALDANESLNISDFEKIKKQTLANILYIEEPFKDLSTLHQLDLTNYPPIAIDEKAIDETTILSIIERYPVKVVVIKPFRIGGIDKVLRLITQLKTHNVKFVVGGMYEYGLSRYFTALLAKEGSYPGDVTPDGYYFDEDFTQGVGKLKRGLISFNPPQVDKSKLLYFN